MDSEMLQRANAWNDEKVHTCRSVVTNSRDAFHLPQAV
jgi:hypothetical protein